MKDEKYWKVGGWKQKQKPKQRRSRIRWEKLKIKKGAKLFEYINVHMSGKIHKIEKNFPNLLSTRKFSFDNNKIRKTFMK
jgi:hypothetical protein